MILYPFPPGSALKCGIAGFDEEKREPAAELYLLAPGAVPPAEFDGGYLFCEAPGCRDTRLLQPVQTAAPDAPAVWCDTQVSGGSLEGYLRGLLPVWGNGSGCISRPSGCCSPSRALPVSERRLTKRRRTR